jgi:hypothetical protein
MCGKDLQIVVYPILNANACDSNPRAGYRTFGLDSDCDRFRSILSPIMIWWNRSPHRLQLTSSFLKYLLFSGRHS